MKILFATDLSEPTDVTESIAKLANRLEAELLVLHVATPTAEAAVTGAEMSAPPGAPIGGAWGGFTPYNAYDPAMEENLQQAEEDAFHRFLTDRFGRTVKAALRKGDPADTILDDAEEQNVDIVALGKHRRGRLERLLLGSTSKAILNDNPRPTLLFPVSDETS